MKRNLVYVVGLGPGDPQFLTAQAKTALENADVLCGYTVYIDLIRSFYPEKEVHATGMTKEIDRCRWALETAQSGKTVALVCSGDAGVYGMASPILELASNYPSVEIEVIPGLTAALSGGAVLGAPLAHDFCVISLSDRLTPWEIIEKRLRRHGRFLRDNLQPVLERPARLFAACRPYFAPKRQIGGDRLRHRTQHWQRKAAK
mgnify:CR=1 FL=1